jgi:hypothetical protein
MMSNTTHSKPTIENDVDDAALSNREPLKSVVPVKGYPGQRTEGTTAKNPKTPETSEETKVARVADKAAHKAAKEEQNFEETSGKIFSK